MAASPSFLTSYDLDDLEGQQPGSLQNVPQLGLSDVSPRAKTEVMCLKEKSHGGRPFSAYHILISGVPAINMTNHQRGNLEYLVK